MGFVLEERDDGIRPVRDVVQRLLISDRPEAGYQDVQLLRTQCAFRDVACLGLHPARVGFGLSSCRETRDRLVVPDDRGELVQQFVHALVPCGREGSERLGQIVGVMVRASTRP